MSLRGVAKRWSRRLSRRGSGRSGGQGDVNDDDLSNDIVNYRSISVAALVRVRDELRRGELSANVEVCTLAGGTDELQAGATVRVVNRRRGQAKVRVPYQKRFFSVPEGLLRDKPRELWTITDVCEFHVTEETNINQAFYFELLEPGDVGKPFQGAFVSQARKCRFGDLVDGLVEYFRDRKGVTDLAKTFVWLDIICANQPKLNQPDADLSDEVRQQRNDLLTHGLHAAIERFDERLVFFNSWDRPEVIGRLWCVWELYGAIKSGKTIEIFFPPGEDDRLAELLDSSDGPDKITKAVAAVDLANAECHSDKDRDMIVGYVETLPGGFGDINRAVLDQVRSWLRQSATELARTRGVNLIKYNVGRILKNMGEYDAALAQFEEEVLALDSQQLGENHPDALTTRHEIACVLQSKGEYDAALAQFEDVLALKTQQLGENHPEVLATRYAIAQVLESKGEYDAALAQFEEVLALQRQQLGENHPSVLTTRYMIAQVLQSKGEYDAALAQFEKVLALRKQQLGENHPHVAISQWQVADVLVDLGQFERGLGLTEAALRTFELSKIEPVRKVRALTTKSRALFGLGRAPEARECLQDAEEAAHGLGEQHPELAAVWHAWGVGPPRDESKLRAALDLREARLGREHPLTRKTRAALQG
ncbi:Kinesin light chain 4 (KLC 4) (Kinesin-like protein 8) [Durusdinium trenchii]|uniref:Kinesin light chain 4 (KLC 4) (Kinesin-like protein 8) n=1 Tax=Durusdinium trenchii TaxID=1381693 RepID=A0ABP0J6M9_9DINO